MVGVWDGSVSHGAGLATTPHRTLPLIVTLTQGDYCYFGAAANWYDQDWTYYPQYDWEVGKPLGAAVQTAPYRWERSFEHCVVSADLESAAGHFKWRSF